MTDRAQGVARAHAATKARAAAIRAMTQRMKDDPELSQAPRQCPECGKPSEARVVWTFTSHPDHKLTAKVAWCHVDDGLDVAECDEPHPDRDLEDDHDDWELPPDFFRLGILAAPDEQIIIWNVLRAKTWRIDLNQEIIVAMTRREHGYELDVGGIGVAQIEDESTQPDGSNIEALVRTFLRFTFGRPANVFKIKVVGPQS
jgi:hypothetical protein